MTLRYDDRRLLLLTLFKYPDILRFVAKTTKPIIRKTLEKNMWFFYYQLLIEQQIKQ